MLNPFDSRVRNGQFSTWFFSHWIYFMSVAMSVAGVVMLSLVPKEQDPLCFWVSVFLIVWPFVLTFFLWAKNRKDLNREWRSY